MTIEDVLKARSVAWGKLGEKRQAFFRTLRAIAEEISDPDQFDRRVASEVQAYLKANQELADDWKTLGLQAGGWILRSGSVGGLIQAASQRLLGLNSWIPALSVAAGTILSNAAPKVVAALRKRSNAEHSAGRILLRPYGGLRLHL